MGHRAVVRFTVVLVAVLASVVAVQVFASGAQRAAEAATAVRVQLARDVEQIRHYDELLTMFAPLAASSRDTSYVTRHRRMVTALDAVIRRALSLTGDPAVNDAIRSTDQANRALVGLEERHRAGVAGHRQRRAGAGRRR